MAKRLTDTNKWDDSWFHSLDMVDKLFWIYVWDKCNYAGIWHANWSLVDYHLSGQKPNMDKFVNKIIELGGDKYYIIGFIDINYGKLNKDSRCHASVLRELDTLSIPYPYPMHRVSECTIYNKLDRDKVIDKDKGVIGGKGEGREKEEGIKHTLCIPYAYPMHTPYMPHPKTTHTTSNDAEVKTIRFAPPSFDEVKAYCLERGKGINPEQWMNHYQANGWMVGQGKKMKDWRAAVRKWEHSQYNNNKQKDQPKRSLQSYINDCK